MADATVTPPVALRLALITVMGMARQNCFTITNPKYRREFDNSDNPCCWQVGAIGDDVENILLEQQIEFESMYEDWGTSFSWICDKGICHSLTISCIDVDLPTFQFEYFAFRRRWLLFSAPVADDASDFGSLVPVLKEALSTAD